MHAMHRAGNRLDQGRLSKRNVFRQHICIGGGDSHVLRECAIDGDSDGSPVEAQVPMTRSTKIAVTAEQRWVDRNPGTDSHFHIPGADSWWDVPSHRNDLARELMARHDRIACQRKVAIHDMQVSATNTTRPHSYHQLVRFRRRVWKAPYPHVARSINDSCTHACPLFLVYSIGLDDTDGYSSTTTDLIFAGLLFVACNARSVSSKE